MMLFFYLERVRWQRRPRRLSIARLNETVPRSGKFNGCGHHLRLVLPVCDPVHIRALVSILEFNSRRKTSGAKRDGGSGFANLRALLRKLKGRRGQALRVVRHRKQELEGVTTT